MEDRAGRTITKDFSGAENRAAAGAGVGRSRDADHNDKVTGVGAHVSVSSGRTGSSEVACRKRGLEETSQDGSCTGKKRMLEGSGAVVREICTRSGSQVKSLSLFAKLSENEAPPGPAAYVSPLNAGACPEIEGSRIPVVKKENEAPPRRACIPSFSVRREPSYTPHRLSGNETVLGSTAFVDPLIAQPLLPGGELPEIELLRSQGMDEEDLARTRSTCLPTFSVGLSLPLSPPPRLRFRNTAVSIFHRTVPNKPLFRGVPRVRGVIKAERENVIMCVMYGDGTKDEDGIELEEGKCYGCRDVSKSFGMWREMDASCLHVETGTSVVYRFKTQTLSAKVGLVDKTAIPDVHLEPTWDLATKKRAVILAVDTFAREHPGRVVHVFGARSRAPTNKTEPFLLKDRGELYVGESEGRCTRDAFINAVWCARGDAGADIAKKYIDERDPFFDLKKTLWAYDHRWRDLKLDLRGGPDFVPDMLETVGEGKTAFDALLSRGEGVYLVRLEDTPIVEYEESVLGGVPLSAVDHVIVVDCGKGIILDSVERYPMRLCKDALLACGGDNTKELRASDIRLVEHFHKDKALRRRAAKATKAAKAAKAAKDKADKSAKDKADKSAKDEADKSAMDEANNSAKDNADTIAKDKVDKSAKGNAHRTALDRAVTSAMGTASASANGNDDADTTAWDKVVSLSMCNAGTSSTGTAGTSAKGNDDADTTGWDGAVTSAMGNAGASGKGNHNADITAWDRAVTSATGTASASAKSNSGASVKSNAGASMKENAGSYVKNNIGASANGTADTFLNGKTDPFVMTADPCYLGRKFGVLPSTHKAKNRK